MRPALLVVMLALAGSVSGGVALVSGAAAQAPPASAAQPVPEWHITATVAESCSCAVSCSCNFGGNPKANFALRLVDSPLYGLNISTVGAGTVAKDPDQSGYSPGTLVELTATPAAHWHFAGWSGDAGGSTNPLSVTMDGVANHTSPSPRAVLTRTPPAGIS